jgi:polyphosphate kinase
MEKRYTNKEISWLSFNERVLQEANDTAVPLIERIKYLGICSNNLDEFYRVRVATLNRLNELGKKAKKFIRDDPEEILEKITKIALKQHDRFGNILKQLRQELANENIFIIDETQLSEELGKFVINYFDVEVRPKLIPIMIDQVDRFPELKDRFIYLAVVMSKKNEESKVKYALIEIPTDVLPRFLILPQKGNNKYIILLDDVIRYCLVDIFSTLPFDNFKAFTIKITRDAELDIDDDLTQSFIDKMDKSLKQRKGGNPVRMIYDAAIPKDFLNFLLKKMKIDKTDSLIVGSKYHNNRDFMNFPKLGRNELFYKSNISLPHKDLLKNRSFFKGIREKDILFHYPYHSFNAVIDFLREASIDPKVTSIKLTIYRVAKNSSVMNALINAVKNGKKVLVVLELQARFDEEANIYWANKLQDEGVRVIFGVPGLKVHSKLCLISRKEKNNEKGYAVIGTGNFNEDTATIYSDHSLFTSERKLTREVNKIFDFFENNYKSSSFKHLITSPFDMRKKIIGLINNEIKNAKNGKEAFIHIKVNNLVDAPIIDKFYEASEAGVEIRLNVRGMNSLIAGVENMSSNIKAIGIVDKYLEHTRIFIFCNDGDEKYFISSADLMPRNIDKRVEVTCPIINKEIQQELRTFFDIQWNDNYKARILNEKLDNQINKNDNNQIYRAQLKIYEFLQKYHLEQQ